MTPVHSRWRRALLPLAASLAIAAPAARPLPLAAQQRAPLAASPRLTSPKAFFGFDIGDDYRLATYDQFADYWRTLAKQSNRAKLVEIGKTAEGRPQLMMIVSAPENLAKLDRYRTISRTLALGQGSEAAAKALAEEGKAVVWIDGGLHATEVLGAHQLIETSWQLLSRNDAETKRILRDAIILLVHANPDGMQLVSSWYMQEPDSSKRNMNIPRLYQKYIGHDNNRDFYVANQPETRNINHVLYWDWFPQIVYNHHQTGPAGTVMFAPPFRDPFNYNYDPMIPAGIDLVGAAMHSRFTAEGKPGVVSRSATSYSTWWNGGLRTMVYFHNMIGLLTETIGNPTPMRIPFVPANQLPRADVMFPIAPQEWHFRQSIDYSLTANYAVLDLAARQKDEFLFRIWRMARNSIERGSRDTWTVTPTEIALVDSAANAMRQDAAAQQGGGRGVVEGAVSVGATRSVDASLYTKYLRDPAKRDPRAYIIPSNQRDFPTAVRFVNALRHAGVAVQRATADFTANGTRYPAGSFVVQAAQAFRPHVLDMFEPQDHPNDFQYPGGPPIPPYDTTGWTLAFQMGVEFDRILDGFDGPFAKIEGLLPPPPTTVSGPATPAGYLVSHQVNNSFKLINWLLKANADVY
ncbi:MAG TPA: M14 metallopeptidase family protein, partial [Gemmatimonadaceae bacterium]